MSLATPFGLGRFVHDVWLLSATNLPRNDIFQLLTSRFSAFQLYEHIMDMPQKCGIFESYMCFCDRNCRICG